MFSIPEDALTLIVIDLSGYVPGSLFRCHRKWRRDNHRRPSERHNQIQGKQRDRCEFNERSTQGQSLFDPRE
jgi:hypothetical protein